MQSGLLGTFQPWSPWISSCFFPELGDESLNNSVTEGGEAAQNLIYENRRMEEELGRLQSGTSSKTYLLIFWRTYLLQ